MRHPVLAAGRFASWAGVATIVARFSFTICQGGKLGRQPRHSGDLAPKFGGKLLARLAHQPVRPANGDGKPAGEGEDPFHRSANDAEYRRKGRRKLHAIMGVDDGAEFVRRIEARNERLRDPRRNGEDDRIAFLNRDLAVAEIERRRPALREIDGAQAPAECNATVRALRYRPAPAR